MVWGLSSKLQGKGECGTDEEIARRQEKGLHAQDEEDHEVGGGSRGVFAVAVLVGALAGYFVGRIDGSQEGEDATPSVPRSVPVEKTVE